MESKLDIADDGTVKIRPTGWGLILLAMEPYRQEIEAAQTMRLVINLGRNAEGRRVVMVNLEHYSKNVKVS